jgi:hypothetical protein
MIEVLFFIIFLCGVLMKLFHLPLHTFVMVGALAFLIVLNVTRLIRNKPGERRTAGWLGLATLSWLIFFLFEVKFFGGTLIVMASALFVSVISILMTLFEPGQLPGGRIILLLAALGLGATTSWMSPHERFYTYNIRFNKNAMTDYRTLDQYSWFLYLGQEYDEAMRVSKLALAEANREGDQDFVKSILEHADAIKSRKWEKYKL